MKNLPTPILRGHFLANLMLIFGGLGLLVLPSSLAAGRLLGGGGDHSSTSIPDGEDSHLRLGAQNHRSLSLTYNEAEERCKSVQAQRDALPTLSPLGTELICECQPVDRDADWVLTCTDPCLYCDSSKTNTVSSEDDGVDPRLDIVIPHGGSACIQYEEKIVFPVNRATSYEESQTISIEYKQGPRRDSTITYTIEADTNGDLTCTSFEVNGAQCSSCTVGTCGKPVVDCTGLDAALDITGVIDFCDGSNEPAIGNILSAVSAVAVPGHGASSGDSVPSALWVCASPAMESCHTERMFAKDDNDGIVCKCTPRRDGYAKLRCDDSCGEYCDAEGTTCGERFVSAFYADTGAKQSGSNTFTFTKPASSGESLAYHYQDGRNLIDPQPYCYGDLFIDSEPFGRCTSCDLKECSNGRIQPVLNCSNLEWNMNDLPLIDMCNPDLTIDAPLLQVFSKTKFRTCEIDGNCAVGGEDYYPLIDFGGSPDELLFPLQLCEGDCDTNDDCAYGLKCMQRGKHDPVPVCSGVLGSRTDYCVPEDGFDLNDLPEIEDCGGSPDSIYFPLSECQGDCDHDYDCADGLFCFQRDQNDPIPGCNGNSPSRSDFCVSNFYISVTRRLRDFGSTPAAKYYPLGRCQGDCDNDDDCQGGMKCHQRNRGDEVPGCVGNLSSNSDFCVESWI